MSLQAFRPAMGKFRKCPCKNKLIEGYCVSFQAKLSPPGDKTCRPEGNYGKFFNGSAQGLRHRRRAADDVGVPEI